MAQLSSRSLVRAHAHARTHALMRPHRHADGTWQLFYSDNFTPSIRLRGTMCSTTSWTSCTAITCEGLGVAVSDRCFADFVLIFSTFPSPIHARTTPHWHGSTPHRTNTCMHACKHACVHVQSYACLHVQSYACLHVQSYACLHVHVQLYALSQTSATSRSQQASEICGTHIFTHIYALAYAHVSAQISRIG